MSFTAVQALMCVPVSVLQAMETMFHDHDTGVDAGMVRPDDITYKVRTASGGGKGFSGSFTAN